MRMIPYTIVTLTAMITAFHHQADAYCARCVKIEEERSKEQAKNPPKQGYYDDLIHLHPQTPKRQMSLGDENSSSNKPNEGSLEGTTYRSSIRKEGKSSSQKEILAYFTQDVKQNSPLSSRNKNQLQELNNPVSSRSSSNFNKNQTEYFEEDSVNLPPIDSSIIRESSNQQELQTHSSTSERKRAISQETTSTLLAILNANNLLETLSGPFTLFIPSDHALQQFSSKFLQKLTLPENQEELSRVVSNHILAKQILSKEFETFKGREIKTIGGRNLTLDLHQRTLTIDGAHILRVEPAGKNGIIYIIDRVLYP